MDSPCALAEAGVRWGGMTDNSARASALLQLHRDPELLTVVNVWDVISAKVVADMPGTTALATASHSIAATLGYPDGENIPVGEMLDDRENLEKLAGYPVRGMSYPFGTYNQAVLDMLPAVGIEYARTVQSTNGFTIPENFLLWHPTCHHKDALSLMEMPCLAKSPSLVANPSVLVLVTLIVIFAFPVMEILPPPSLTPLI